MSTRCLGLWSLHNSWPAFPSKNVKDATQAKSSNWHAFRAPDQEWERTHYQRQSKIESMIQSVVVNGRRAGAPKSFDKAWSGVLQSDLGAIAGGFRVVSMQAVVYASVVPTTTKVQRQRLCGEVSQGARGRAG